MSTRSSGSADPPHVVVVGSMAVLVLLNLPGMLLLRFGGPLANLVVVATLLLLVVAGLVVGVRLAVSIPAVVVEGRRWPQALSRSWSLVAGHWGHVLATLLLAFVAIGLVGSVLSVLLSVLIAPLALNGWLARALVQAAVDALILPYFLTVWVLLYLDLRARKEHLGLGKLSADLRASKA